MLRGYHAELEALKKKKFQYDKLTDADIRQLISIRNKREAIDFNRIGRTEKRVWNPEFAAAEENLAKLGTAIGKAVENPRRVKDPVLRDVLLKNPDLGKRWLLIIEELKKKGLSFK